MPPAARMGDNTMHDAPHCHGAHGWPVPHPPQPFAIVMGCSPNVLFNNIPAATMGSMTLPCTLAGCAPGAPGFVAKGSATVMVNGKPVARAGDPITWPTCVGPIPCPTGKIIPPCSPDIDIGG